MTPFFWSEIFTVAPKLKALAQIPPESVCFRSTECWGWKNNGFSNQFGVSVLSETWVTLEELYGASLFSGFFSVLKISICFGCFGDCCNVALLWNSRNVLLTAKLKDKSLKYKTLMQRYLGVWKFESSEYLGFICRTILTDIYIRNTCRFCFVQTVGGLPSGYRGSKETPCETDGARQTDLCWRVVS